MFFALNFLLRKVSTIMLFDLCNSILYSDTLVPDIFITEYLPSMNSDYIKIYIYFLFLSKHKKQIVNEEISKKLNIDISIVNSAFIFFETMGIITKGNDTILLQDLKEKEINKLYRLKTTSSPEETLTSSDKNKKRNQIVTVINEKFFQGVMSPSWYTDIDSWFDRYKFDEDVMYTLFQHCYDHNGLAKSYILKVAENWHCKKIKTAIDLDKYYMEYQKVKDIKLKIVKKLKLSRYLTEYEEEFLENWITKFNYDFDIIEIVLKKTTGKTNPNFNYINAILTSWHNNGLRTKEEIWAHIARENTVSKGNSRFESKDTVPQRTNFAQRKYTDDQFDNFVANVRKKAST